MRQHFSETHTLWLRLLTWGLTCPVGYSLSSESLSISQAVRSKGKLSLAGMSPVVLPQMAVVRLSTFLSAEVRERLQESPESHMSPPFQVVDLSVRCSSLPDNW